MKIFAPLLAATLLVSVASAAPVRGGTSAQTDLASITVTPLARQAGAKVDWQTIYNYSGGILPPGSQIISEGKWIDPPMRHDQTGITFSFPDLPDSPENSQYLHIGLGLDRPIANYPTRATIQYTSFFDQRMPGGIWSPFSILTSNNEKGVLFGHLTTQVFKAATRGKNGGKSTNTSPAVSTAIPLKPVGDNTLIFSLGGDSAPSITMNGQDATDFFGLKGKVTKKPRPEAMLFNKLVFYDNMTQFPHNKGDWFAVHSFKIEQLRPPLENSSEAAIDLTVPGREPVTVTIEVVDAWNDSKGYVLCDATVSPGQYRLYWDGIDQKNSDTAWIGAGSYTFRLTTGKTAMRCVGDINNSAPKYTTLSYGMVGCTALAITPPGTTVLPGAGSPKWKDDNNANDTRKLDATDSVQSLGLSYDSNRGLWISADGAVIATQIGDTQMNKARALAMTPPDPSDPTNPAKQFYFVSQSIKTGNTVISSSFRSEDKTDSFLPKTLTSPDWNRPKPAFVPYQVKIGQIAGGATLGPQHDLFFMMGGRGGSGVQADWMIRNIRLYEEGSPDPGPMTFDPSLFSVRGAKNGGSSATAPLTQVSETAPPVPTPAKKVPQAPPIPPGAVTVGDNGHTVRLKDAPSVNYPVNYTVTPKTIMAFDLDVVDHSHAGKDNGIGLSPDPSSTNKGNASPFFNFLGGKDAHPHGGFKDPSEGAFTYPTYKPNTLYTDSVPLPPPAPIHNHSSDSEMRFLWQPGFYGLKISENGKFLFACNNADNRLEIYDISTDGHAVAKISIDYPMYVALAPEGAAGARQGTRYVYVDSPNAGLVRIAWNLSDNTFGKPETITPASEFAYPRGIVYNGVADRLFVCDTFNLDRSKEANQIAVINPNTGKVLSRFGKKGGVDPSTGGQIDDETFTCPLTIDADSKGALWVNDYFSCEMRKYDFDSASNGFKLERRVLGPGYSNCSHFFWLPDAPPTQVWTVADYFVRTDADIDADGRFTNQRNTSATELIGADERPYPHFCKVGDHIYAVFEGEDIINERVGDGWVPRFGFGGAHGDGIKDMGDAETMARKHGLLAAPGQPPTDLDKAIAASGDADWASRPWTWSDLNGDGKMEYTKDNPEFKIYFNAKFSLTGRSTSSTFRSSDGAYVCPDNDKKGDAHSLLVLPPQMVNGKPSYDWANAKVIPCADGPEISDVLAQDGRFYVLRSSRDLYKPCAIECYDESGKLLWTREHNSKDLVSLQSFGDGMITIMDRGWSTLGPVTIRTKDGDLVSQVVCRDAADCWANGALRADADTGYIGLVQAYKVAGLSTVKSAATTVNLSRADH